MRYLLVDLRVEKPVGFVELWVVADVEHSRRDELFGLEPKKRTNRVTEVAGGPLLGCPKISVPVSPPGRVP